MIENTLCVVNTQHTRGSPLLGMAASSALTDLVSLIRVSMLALMIAQAPRLPCGCGRGRAHHNPGQLEGAGLWLQSKRKSLGLGGPGDRNGDGVSMVIVEEANRGKA